jgi:hypothetical protein
MFNVYFTGTADFQNCVSGYTYAERIRSLNALQFDPITPYFFNTVIMELIIDICIVDDLGRLSW